MPPPEPPAAAAPARRGRGVLLEAECFPLTDVRAFTECARLPVAVRARRQAELGAFGPDAFGIEGGFVLAAFGAITSPLSESTTWAWRGRRVYDQATDSRC